MSDKPLSIASAPNMHLVRSLFANTERIGASDFLRREISQRMADRLDLLKIDPEWILDAGCGAGMDHTMLQQRYPNSKIIDLDASQQLLSQAQNRLVASATDNAMDLICGDFARMPLENQSLDLLWSNLALHWHASAEAVFAEWRRVLRRDGLLMFSCFGPDTFKEVRHAFLEVDDYPHTLDFADMHNLGDSLLACGFTTPVVDMEIVTLTYETVEKLLHDVRAFGGNPLPDRRRGLLGKNAWKKLRRGLESNRSSDGRIPLTVEVIYGHAFMPAERQTKAGESAIHFFPRA